MTSEAGGCIPRRRRSSSKSGLTTAKGFGSIARVDGTFAKSPHEPPDGTTDAAHPRPRLVDRMRTATSQRERGHAAYRPAFPADRARVAPVAVLRPPSPAFASFRPPTSPIQQSTPPRPPLGSQPPRDTNTRRRRPHHRPRLPHHPTTLRPPPPHPAPLLRRRAASSRCRYL
jgi:hypothetical protein